MIIAAIILLVLAIVIIFASPFFIKLVPLVNLKKGELEEDFLVLSDENNKYLKSVQILKNLKNDITEIKIERNDDIKKAKISITYFDKKKVHVKHYNVVFNKEDIVTIKVPNALKVNNINLYVDNVNETNNNFYFLEQIKKVSIHLATLFEWIGASCLIASILLFIFNANNIFAFDKNYGVGLIILASTLDALLYVSILYINFAVYGKYIKGGAFYEGN